MALFDVSEREQVYIALNLIMSIIGSAASITNIAVIRRMQQSGYLLLLCTMMVFQLMYDLTFFFSNVNIGYWVTTVADVFQIFGGIGGSLASNFIAIVVTKIVVRKKSIDIFAWYRFMLAVCLVTPLANSIVYLVGRVPENAHPDLARESLLGMYYYIRLSSIMFNFIMFGISAYYIQMTRSKGRTKSTAEIAVSTLSRRLIYYPIVQAIGRSGYAFYEAKYGDDFNVDTASNTQYAGLIYISIVTPLVSVGYLIIFLLLQPSAYDEFRAMLGLKPLPKPDPATRPSRSTIAQQHRSTVAHSNHHSSTVDVELVGSGAVSSWFRPTHGGEEGDRDTSFAGWAKSSIAFMYEEEALGGFDARTEDELVRAMAEEELSVTDASNTTTSSLHQSMSSVGSLSVSSYSVSRKLELNSMSSASTGVRSVGSDVPGVEL